MIAGTKLKLKKTEGIAEVVGFIPAAQSIKNETEVIINFCGVNFKLTASEANTLFDVCAPVVEEVLVEPVVVENTVAKEAKPKTRKKGAK